MPSALETPQHERSQGHQSPRALKPQLTWPQVPQCEVVVGAISDQLVPVAHQSGGQSDAVLLHLLEEERRMREMGGVSRPGTEQGAGYGAQPDPFSSKIGTAQER